MSEKKIQVNTKTLEQDVRDMEGEVKDITRKMDGLFDEIHDLDTMWDGAANQMINAQFTEDAEKMKEICEVLTKYVECCQYAKKEYDSRENTIYDMIKSMRI